MGAHHKGPGKVAQGNQTLDQLIAEQPASILGTQVADQFANRLPFLLKVLDVKDMLSIQVHPSKKAAEIGYAEEEKKGIDRSAPDRNYRDDNHKPELGVALTDFYLLHGFKPEEEIERAITQVPGWGGLLPAFERGGVKELYRTVMEADQARLDSWLNPLVDSLGPESNYDRSQPEFWAARAVAQYSKDGHHDRGLFSIYWFNIVHLTPGQGIFQDAGIPHAYLEGVCIELMANSDNVLRGGLTPKHIDVPELLDKTKFHAKSVEKLLPKPSSHEGWLHYPTPAPDFQLYLAQLHEGGKVEVDTTKGGPAILLLLTGEAQGIREKVLLNETQRTVFVPAGERFTLQGLSETTIYRASVS